MKHLVLGNWRLSQRVRHVNPSPLSTVTGEGEKAVEGGRGSSAGGDLIKHGVLGKPPHHLDEEEEYEDRKADFRGRSLHDYRKR